MGEAGARNNTLPDVPLADKRAYYLVCLCCRSRLEVAASLAGEACKCPTCGIHFTVPPLQQLMACRVQPVPVGRLLEERIAPHAYAAAGEMAPEVIEDPGGAPVIRCRRCATINIIDANACRSCGIPFAVEPGIVEPALPVDGWALGSVVLGIVSLATYYVPAVAAGAIVTGLLAMRRARVHYGGAQRVAAWLGVVLGGLATMGYVVRFVSGSGR
jgi:hypothetical protein